MEEKNINEKAFEWLKYFHENFAALKEGRKNIFHISGFPNWENVNSNFLAFYLNVNEDHGFNRLFIESLLDCIQDEIGDDADFERTQFESTFKIHREYGSNKGGRIDILIEGDKEEDELIQDELKKSEVKSQWALIIENKIYHHLANDLNDYWKSIKANHKIGIVLSPHKHSLKELKLKNGIQFINITHGDLVNKIENHLPKYFLKSDDRHLLFLKEYITNIKSLYQSNMNSEALLNQLDQFHKNRKEVLHVINVNQQLLSFLNEEVTKAFESILFETVSNITARAKHYYPIVQENSNFREQQAFRFWVDLNRLRFDKHFYCIFELYHKRNMANGEKLRENLKEKIEYSSQLKQSKSSITKNECHLFRIEFDLNNFQEIGFNQDISAELKKALEWNNETNQSKVLQIVLNTWTQLKTIEKD